VTPASCFGGALRNFAIAARILARPSAPGFVSETCSVTNSPTRSIHVIEVIEHGLAARAVPRDELGEDQARRHAIFVAHERADRVTERLFVAEHEAAARLAFVVHRRVADPFEAGQRLAIVGAGVAREKREQLR
jgi:hypothetical protein